MTKVNEQVDCIYKYCRLEICSTVKEIKLTVKKKEIL